ncbi:hypothetical protein [Kibdelosporangium philippinense]
MVVERHRLNTQFLRHPSHSDRSGAAAIRNLDRSLQHTISTERRPRW